MQRPLLKPGIRTKSRPGVSGKNCSVYQSKLENKEMELGSAFQWKEGEAQMAREKNESSPGYLRMPGVSARGSVTWKCKDGN